MMRVFCWAAIAAIWHASLPARSRVYRASTGQSFLHKKRPASLQMRAKTSASTSPMQCQNLEAVDQAGVDADLLRSLPGTRSLARPTLYMSDERRLRTTA
jgi:hypothetical protein